MSSRQNSRNLFTNVFRPTYVYDGNQFRAGLVMSNITSVRSDIIGSGILEIGDGSGNVYIGTGSGSVGLSNYNNVAIGVNAAGGISNVSNSVFIGSNAGAGLVNAEETTIIGTNNTVTGTRNVVLGSRDLVTGNNNVIIGSDLSENRSYRLNIGNLILGDISLGGDLLFNANVNINGTLECAAFAAGGLDASNLYIDSSGFIRNGAGATPFTIDLSSGNFKFSGTGVSRVYDVSFYRGRINAPSGIFGTGYDLSSTLALTGDVSSGGRVAAVNFFGNPTASNNIGGVTLSSSNISNASTSSNVIGGVTLSNTNISYAGTITGSTDSASNKIGGVTLSNTNISYSGTITGSTDNTSNRIGGVTLSNTNVSNVGTVSSTNAIVSGYLRNALTPGQFDISGGNISNSATHIASNFVGTSSASNSIGGVTLSNAGNTITLGNGFITDISTTPYFRLGTTASNFQVDMSGGNISNSATHIASNFVGTSSASNSIGGVTLSNAGNTITLGNGFITDISTTPYFRLGTTASNFQVDMSGGNISNSATHTASNFVTPTASSNSIGGVTLSSNNISNASNSSNVIGGVLVTNSNILTGIGTVSAPSYTFSNDASSGLYRASASNLGIVTAGRERVRISSNGNVGIATTTPQSPLDVCGDIAATSTGLVKGSVILRGNAWAIDPSASEVIAGQTLYVADVNGPYYATIRGVIQANQNTDAMDLRFTTNQTNSCNAQIDRMTIKAFTGDVGIGTTLPTARLTVCGNILASGTISNFSTTTSSNFVTPTASSNSIGGITLNGNNISYSGTISNSTAASSNVIGGVLLSNNNVFTGSGTVSAPSHTFSTDASSGLYLASASNLGITAGGVERVRIASSGNVGIGNAPAYRLDVSGITMVRGTLYGGAAAATGGLVPGNYLGIYSNILYNETSTGGLYIGAGGLCNTIVGRNGTIYITADGSRVGIGTNVPGYTLDVAGVARISNNYLRVERNGTASTASNVDFGNEDTLALKSTIAYSSSTPIASLAFAGATDYPIARIYGIGVGTTAIGQYRGELVFQTGITASLGERMRINYLGNVGIGTSNPAHTLDVNGTIRGSSNIVSVATTSNWVGSYTSFTDTSLTITYTPKQSGSVRLMVIANAELLVGSGAGNSDGVNLAIRNNGTILTDYNLNFDVQAVVGRSTNNHYSGGRMAIVSVTGQSLINMRITRIGDDDSTVRNGYLSIHELSTT